MLLQLYTHSPISSRKVTLRHLLGEEEMLRKFVFSDARSDLILRNSTVKPDSVARIMRNQEIKSRPESLWCWVSWVLGSTLWLFTRLQRCITGMGILSSWQSPTLVPWLWSNSHYCGRGWVEVPETVPLLPPAPHSARIVTHTLGGIAEIRATMKYLKDIGMRVPVMFFFHLIVRALKNLCVLWW